MADKRETIEKGIYDGGCEEIGKNEEGDTVMECRATREDPSGNGVRIDIAYANVILKREGGRVFKKVSGRHVSEQEAYKAVNFVIDRWLDGKR